MSWHTLEGGTGNALRLQLTDAAPLVRLTNEGGEAFYLNANEIVAVYPSGTGSKISMKGSDSDTFWRCVEDPLTVYSNASRSQRRV